MPAAPSKIMVIAPNSYVAEHVAAKVNVPKGDYVWIRDHRMLKGIAAAQIVEAYSLRPFQALETDSRWREEYSKIQEEAQKVIKNGHLETYALVYCK